MKTVLITAYAVNPYKGSEDATGWNISAELAKDFRVILITRKNNLPHVNQYLKEHPAKHLTHLHCHGYDLPQPLRWLKKKLGERGYVLYFYFWQMFVPLFILRKRMKFDIAHSLNFHSDSQPNFLWIFKKPTFWGPVGHHPQVPREYMYLYGQRSKWSNQFYHSVKWAFRNLDPFFSLSKKFVRHVFVINSAVPDAMGLEADKWSILPAVAAKEPTKQPVIKNGFTVLSVGRFHYIKGFDIALQAFAQMLMGLEAEEQRKAKLVLVGKGSEKQRLVDLAQQLEIAENVVFKDWVERDKMGELYALADVFLFPSHEGAGMVIPEAMSHGLPIVCFDNVGPGELVGSSAIKVPYGTYEEVVASFAKGLKCFAESEELRETYGQLAELHYRENYTWEAKAAAIKKQYLLHLPPEGAVAVFHPSAELYGADRILANALNAFPPEIKKTVYLRFNGPLAEHLTSEVQNLEVKHLRFMPVMYRAVFTPFGMVRFIAEYIHFFIWMRSEVRKHGFSSAYVNTLSMAHLLPILKFAGLKTLCHVHEIIERPRFMAQLTTALIARHADLVMCVSQAVKNNLLRYNKSLDSSVTVIHNGIKGFTSSAKEGSNEHLHFYLFGRIMPKKGQWFLLDALTKIDRELLSKARFTLMGGAVLGKEEEVDRIKQIIIEKNLDEQVRILPFAKCINSAMQKADVCLVPSLMKDPFPTTVLEAMSAGKPVIATNHGGAKEALEEGKSGVLIEPGESVEFANEISLFIRNKEKIKVMGRSAKERFQNHFTLEHFKERWQAALQSAELI